MKKTCPFCGEEVTTNRKFCSDKCRKKYHYHQNKQEKVCIKCNKTFIATSNTKFCSSKCRNGSIHKTMKNCPVCNKRFKARWDKKYCSQKCYRIANDKTKGFEKATCMVCGSVYRRKKRSNVFTCSETCGSKMLTLASNKILLEMFNTTDTKKIRKIVGDLIETQL